MSIEKPRTLRRLHTRLASFRQLEVFLTVAEHLSVGAAAQSLHLAQPTVSTQLGRLADQVGMPLFEQLGRRLYLTPAGECLQAGCREIFEALARTDMQLSRLAGAQTGCLRIASVTTAKSLLPAYLGRFSATYPDIDIEFQIANRDALIARLKENRDELYVFSHPPTELDIVAEPFADNPLIVVAPADHPLVGRSGLHWEDLAAFPFLIRETGSGTRLSLEKACREYAWSLKPRMTIASNEAIRACVMSGLGLTVLSRHAVADELGRRLVELDVADFPLRNTWYVVHWRGKALSPVAREFLAFLQERETPA